MNESAAPATVFLATPSPNPVRDVAALRFALPREADVSHRIFDVGGRLVRDLATGPFAAGEHRLAWDLRNDSGGTAHAGICFAQLTVEGSTRSVRFVVAR